MPLILYFAAGSIPSRACLLLIRTLKLDVEVKHVNLAAGEQFSPEFLKLNPQHKVPVLVDGDFVLTEGKAILGYLINKFKPGSSLYPNDAQKRARVEQRLSYEGVVYDSIAQIVSSVVFQKMETVSKAQRDKITEILNNLESFLANRKWFAGDEISIADFAILPSVTTFKELGLDFKQYPKLSEWYTKCQTLPGFDENLNGARFLAQMVLSKIGGKF